MSLNLASYGAKQQELVREVNRKKVPDTVQTINELAQHVDGEFTARKERPKVADTHIRVTLLMEVGLNNRLNAFKNAEGKGWKTMAINRAIEALLREYENNVDNHTR